MDFTAAARELEVKTIDLYRFASRNPRVLDDLFGAELDRVSKSVAWFDQALSGTPREGDVGLRQRTSAGTSEQAFGSCSG
jgi:hypothetical protein